ncbi:MAG: hypothetical protein MHM6MM_008574, partial [Cercozoa sp. M6MM]
MKFLSTTLIVAVAASATWPVVAQDEFPGDRVRDDDSSLSSCGFHSMTFPPSTTLDQIGSAVESCVVSSASPAAGRCNAAVSEKSGQLKLTCYPGACELPTWAVTAGSEWKWAVCSGGSGSNGASCSYVPDSVPHISMSAASAQVYGTAGMHVKCRAWCASNFDPAVGEQRTIFGLTNRNDRPGDDMECYCMTQNEWNQAASHGYLCNDSCRNLPHSSPCFDTTTTLC